MAGEWKDVNLEQMQQALQQERSENAVLRSLVEQLQLNSDLHRKTARNEEELDDREDDEDDGVEQNRNIRLHPKRSNQHNHEGFSAELQLKNAEERIAQLEMQFLDAEETICHLKAEKLAALREVERLTIALTQQHQEKHNKDEKAGPQDERAEKEDVELRQSEEEWSVQVAELQWRLRKLQEQNSVEQEERMAVIREQEREVYELRVELNEKADQLEDLMNKYADLKNQLEEHRRSEQDELHEEMNRSLSIDGDGEEDECQVHSDYGSGYITDQSWQEELVRHPTPHFDLHSPEVQYLLHNWSTNMTKLNYLRMWFTQVVVTRGPLPKDFPLGIELPRLLPEVRDGFLTLVVPLLRKQTEREIQVHSRQYNDQFHTDLRLRVVPRR